MGVSSLARQPVRVMIAGLAIIGAAGGPLWAAGVSDLSAYRSQWTAAAIDDYEYGYNKYCECHGDSPPETRVSVRGGQVSGVRHLPANSAREIAADPRNFGLYWTIDEIFDLLESAVAREANVRADFDRDLGYPIRFFIDYDEDLIGDEVDIRIIRFSR